MVIIDKSGPVLGRDTCLATTYIMKKNQRQLRMWLCHGRVNILSGGHRELSPSCKMPEGPWLVPSQEDGSVLFSLSFLVFLHFNFVLCCNHISTFFLFNFSGQFHMPLSYFMRNFFSEKLAYNHLPNSMPPFWHVKCLLSIRPHSFLQFPLLCLGRSFSLPSPILILLWDLLVPFTKFCLHLSQWPQKALDSGSHMIVRCLCLYNINNFEIVSKGLLHSQALNSFKRCCNLK